MGEYYSLKFLMNTALDFVRLKSKINVSVATMMDVILFRRWYVKN